MRQKPLFRLSRTLPLLLFALLAILPNLSACASRDVQAPSREQIEAHRDELNARARARTFTETSAPYLQGRLVSLAHDVRDSALLQTRVTLKQKGTKEGMGKIWLFSHQRSPMCKTLFPWKMWAV